MNQRIFLLLFACTLAAPLQATQSRALTNAVAHAGFDQRLNEQLPLHLTFQDQTGRSVTLDQLLQDRPAIVLFGYYRCPQLCDEVLNGVCRTLRTLPLEAGRDYDLIIISIDPEETPAQAAAKKKRYLQSYNVPGARSGWHFLTGEPDSVETAASAIGFRYFKDPNTGHYAHAAGLAVVAPNGTIARYLFGIDFSPRDLKFALQEAAQGRIGSPIDQLLLLCYQYDPFTGKYGVVIDRVLKLFGAVTLAILTSFIGVMLYREKRLKARGGRPGSPRSSAPHRS